MILSAPRKATGVSKPGTSRIQPSRVQPKAAPAVRSSGLSGPKSGSGVKSASGPKAAAAAGKDSAEMKKLLTEVRKITLGVSAHHGVV